MSKSGLGVSTGIPGFRVGSGPRENYVHMGRGGVYYRASLDGRRRGPSPVHSPSAIPMADTTGATAPALEPTGPDDLVGQLNTAASRFLWWWPAAILGAILALSVRGIAGLVLAALTIPVCVWLYHHDQARRTVVLFYDLHDEAEQWFQALITQWSWLSQSLGLRRVTQSGAIDTPYHVKRNAGAATMISSLVATAGLSGPAQLRTNIAIPTIVAGKAALYFLPDRLLVGHGKTFSDVSYEHLAVTHNTARFIESALPPADGTVAGSTWLYVNKDGGPDRRFNDNRRLPVMLYGRIVLSTRTGLYWMLQISRHQAAEPVAQVISLGARYAGQVGLARDPSVSIDDAGTAARADRQNQLYLQGDPRGIYGQYPPAALDGDTPAP